MTLLAIASRKATVKIRVAILADGTHRGPLAKAELKVHPNVKSPMIAAA
jgi:hypothetical protein